MKRQASYFVIAAACAALFAGPALAQGAPMKDMGSGGGKSMSAPKKAKSMKTAKAGAMKHTCMDYAWESQDAKDCEAGKIKPPTWR